MKKIVCVLLALLTLIPCLAFADGPDYSSMTADELRAVIVDARAALAALEEPFTDKCVVYDDSGIKVTVTGIRKDNDLNWYYINVTVVNKSESKISVAFTEPYINGWKVSGSYIFISEVESGRNAKKEIMFTSLAEEAEIKQLEEIEDFAFVLKITDSETRKTLYVADEQTIAFSW